MSLCCYWCCYWCCHCHCQTHLELNHIARVEAIERLPASSASSSPLLLSSLSSSSAAVRFGLHDDDEVAAGLSPGPWAARLRTPPLHSARAIWVARAGVFIEPQPSSLVTRLIRPPAANYRATIVLAVSVRAHRSFPSMHASLLSCGTLFPSDPSAPAPALSLAE